MQFSTPLELPCLSIPIFSDWHLITFFAFLLSCCILSSPLILSLSLFVFLPISSKCPSFVYLFIYCTCSNMTYIFLMAMEWEIRLKWENKHKCKKKKKKSKHFLNSIRHLNCMLRSNWLKVVVIYVFFMNVMDGWLDSVCKCLILRICSYCIFVYMHSFDLMNAETWESWESQSWYEAGGKKKGESNKILCSTLSSLLFLLSARGRTCSS